MIFFYFFHRKLISCGFILLMQCDYTMYVVISNQEWLNVLHYGDCLLTLTESIVTGDNTYHTPCLLCRKSFPFRITIPSTRKMMCFVILIPGKFTPTISKTVQRCLNLASINPIVWQSDHKLGEQTVRLTEPFGLGTKVPVIGHRINTLVRLYVNFYDIGECESLYPRI